MLLAPVVEIFVFYSDVSWLCIKLIDRARMMYMRLCLRIVLESRQDLFCMKQNLSLCQTYVVYSCKES